MADFDVEQTNNEESVYEYDEAFEFEAPRWCDLNAPDCNFDQGNDSWFDVPHAGHEAGGIPLSETKKRKSVVSSEVSKSMKDSKSNPPLHPNLKILNSPKHSPVKMTRNKYDSKLNHSIETNPNLSNHTNLDFQKTSHEVKSSELHDREDSFLIVQSMKKVNLESNSHQINDSQPELGFPPTIPNTSQNFKNKSPLLTSAPSSKPTFPSPPMQTDPGKFPVIKISPETVSSSSNSPSEQPTKKPDMPKPARVPIPANNEEDLEQLVEQFFQENQLEEVDYNACYEGNEENQENEEFQQFYEEMDDIIELPMKSPEKFRFPVCKAPQPPSYNSKTSTKSTTLNSSRPKQETTQTRKPLQVRNGTTKEPPKKIPPKALKPVFTAAPATQKVIFTILNNSQKAPPAKKPKVGNSVVDIPDDVKAMLEEHNKKFKPKASYVPQTFSTRDVRMWEKETGKRWMDCTMEDREEANEWIKKMKENQIKQYTAW